MTTKTDFKKTLPCYKGKHHTLQTLDIPRLQYLMIDGQGDPNTSAHYRDAIATLFPLSYQLKNISKKVLGQDYVVMPLESLWWADEQHYFTDARDKSRWYYTVMIMQPEWISDEHLHAAKTAVRSKVPGDLLDDIRLQTLDEGLSVQTLHIGSFDSEADILKQLHEEYLPAHGLAAHGKHHEIYFSDARKIAPEKWRTLLRQPVVSCEKG